MLCWGIDVMGDWCFFVRCKWVGGTCPEVFWGSSALPVTCMGSKAMKITIKACGYDAPLLAVLKIHFAKIITKFF